MKSFKKMAMAAALVSPLVSQAGGLYMYEMGTSDLGFANAGSAARAADASTLYSNPAGMTRLQGDQITVAAQVLYGKLEYELDGNSILGDKDPDNAIGWEPGGSAFVSHSINDDLKIGLGLYDNFGLSLDFGESWSAKEIVTTSTLTAFTLQPTIAYRINAQWSIGAGLTVNYALFEMERVRDIDNSVEKLDDDDWAYGGRIGVIYEPSASTRFGLVWGSEVKYDYHVDGSYTHQISGRTVTIPLSLGVTAPQQIMFSAYHQLNEDWAIMGNLGWQDWSRFSDANIETEGTTVHSTLELEDTWHAAVGAQHTLNDKVKLNMGIAFDTSMYKDQSKTSFALPSADTWRFGAGMDYALSSQSDLGVAAEYLYSDDASDPSVLVGGSYDNPTMIFVGVNYSYRF